MDMDRSKEKLKKYIEEQITKMFSQVLDYTEVSVGEKERFKVVRSRILKVSNDAIRDIQKHLDSRYDVSYLPPAEDIIKVTRK